MLIIFTIVPCVIIFTVCLYYGIWRPYLIRKWAREAEAEADIESYPAPAAPPPLRFFSLSDVYKK